MRWRSSSASCGQALMNRLNPSEILSRDTSSGALPYHGFPTRAQRTQHGLATRGTKESRAFKAYARARYDPSMPQTNKLAIIGAGSVGATIAYSSMIRGVARHIALYDTNRAKV